MQNSKRAIINIVFVEFLIIVWCVAFYGFSLTALQTTTRFSGRLSLIIFSFIFLLNNKPDKLSNWFSGNFYLIFAIAHGIHLIELLSFVTLSGAKPIPIRLLGGFMAYLIIFLMPYFKKLVDLGKITGRTFQYLKNFYLYYVWFIFFMTYLPRVLGSLPNVGGSYWEFIVLFTWVLVMLTIKISGLFRLSPARNA